MLESMPAHSFWWFEGACRSLCSVVGRWIYRVLVESICVPRDRIFGYSCTVVYRNHVFCVGVRIESHFSVFPRLDQLIFD